MKLITAPGMAGQAKSMDRLISAIGPRLDCTAIQYPDDKPLTNDEYIAHIRSHFPDNGEPFILLGESFGSQRAYEIALTKPKGLVGVVFIVGFLGNPNPVLTQVSNVPALDHWVNLPSDPALVAAFHGWKGPNAIERMGDLIEEAKRTEPPVTRSRIEIMRHQKVPAGAPLDLPAICIDARRDRLVTKGASQRLSNNLGNATRYLLDGPHFLIHSHPAEIADVVAGFSQRLL